MSDAPSKAIRHFGTDEPVEPMRTLRAGPLSVELDQGALRFVRVHGREAIRNIAFVVRDKDWGTYLPEIENLEIDQRDDGFTVGYEATCKDEGQELRYRARIEGRADGSLVFEGTGTAVTDFLTNRTGFVVLHPVDGVSGRPVRVEHVDGRTVESEFPALVDPMQPFRDIRALTHEVVPGVWLTCRMEGDTFEMEDHRQWNDASYKTYVRPLGLPWPFTIPAGETTEQSVALRVEGTPHEDTGGDDDAIVLRVGTDATDVGTPGVSKADTAGTLPPIGLGLEPEHADAALEHVDLVRAIGARYLLAWHDLRAGHGAEELGKAARLADAIDAELHLEVVIPCEDHAAEIARLASDVTKAKASVTAITVSPSEYLRSIMPGSTWPDVPPLAEIYDATRAAFPEATIGGGMLAYFPELNRHRPPVEHIDFVTHASNTITHACDDVTVTENLEALPWVIETCRSFVGDKPYRVGPSSIAMRFNPYGSRTMDNPGNGRIAMARMDPRQRGLINAAWTLGYVAHAARGALDAVALHAPVGEFGLVYHPMPWAQPWYDDADAKVYPAWHVVRGLAAGAGRERVPSASSRSHDVECVAWRGDDGATVLWLANLTGEPRRVRVDGLDGKRCRLGVLDADGFVDAVTDPESFGDSAEHRAGDALALAPYAVVRLSG